MKRIIFLIVCVLFSAMPLLADHVDPETAKKVATTFLSNNGAKATQLTDLTMSAGFPNLFIFNAEEGFVVISADDCVKPILGYSLTEKFVVEEMPENLVWWLQGYSNEIQFAIDNQMKASSETAQLWKDLAAGKPDATKTSVVVSPLIQTSWGQKTPYNNLCPQHDGKRAITGCVATAMAQIMYYHQWPNQGIGSHSYHHNTYGDLYANFAGTTYDWSNMLLDYQSGYDATQATAVATLMSHCGIAVNMNYGTSSSGAFSMEIPQALINYFNYSTTARTVLRYEDDDAWKDLLKAELNANRPMEYGGSGSGGHSFICDGYNDDDYFHFNWGWYGKYNNTYFTLDDLTPGDNNYNYDQSATIGIKKALCSVGAPSNFTAQIIEGTRDARLEWDAVSGAVSYCIFRNGTRIDSIAASKTGRVSYSDNRIPYGTNVYFVRSVDSDKEMSLPSAYQDLSIQFAPPTNLTASYTNGKVSLAWQASANASAYNIYRNDVLIAADVNALSYEDTPIPGNLSYYLKGIDVLGDESSASNVASVSVPYHTPPVADHLRASLSDGNVTLSWTAPDWYYPPTPSAEITYHSSESPYYFFTSTYYGQRFPAEHLATYAGQTLYKVSTYIYYMGTYTVYIYTNTVNGNPDPEALQDIQVLKCPNGDSWIDIPLNGPIPITGTTDLWIVIKQEDIEADYPIPTFNLPSYNADACYYGSTTPTDLEAVSNQYAISWFIKASLSTYSYNLYDNDAKVNGDVPISGTSYTPSVLSDNTTHHFSVKTCFNGGESAASNMVGVTLGSTAATDLNLNENNTLVLAEGSSLTVSGTITNTDPANLIIEDGAQLIHPNCTVQATMEKTIQPYTEGISDGWYTIASPVNDYSVNSVTTGTYDLYSYDEKDVYWCNQKQAANNITQFTEGRGFLYANADMQSLNFAGNMKATAEQVTVPMSYQSNNKDLKGFNLMGNPFTRSLNYGDITLGGEPITTYYSADGGKELVLHNITADPIKPGQGFLVQATAEGQNLVFNPTSSKGKELKPSYICIEAGDDSFTDRAIVQFDEGTILHKTSLSDNTAKLSVRHHNADFAAVTIQPNVNELSLNFKAHQNGTYTLTVSTLTSQLSTLHLIDNLTGEDIDLLATPSYEFEAKTDDYPSRFRLVFGTQQNGEENSQEDFVFVQDGKIVIHGEGIVQIMDMTGRVISTRVVETPYYDVYTTGMTPGVYVLQIINKNEIKTQKIIIK